MQQNAPTCGRPLLNPQKGVRFAKFNRAGMNVQKKIGGTFPAERELRPAPACIFAGTGKSRLFMKPRLVGGEIHSVKFIGISLPGIKS